MSRILFAPKQLDDIAHDPTLVYRSRVGLSANEKEEQFASNDNKSYLFYFFFFQSENPKKGNVVAVATRQIIQSHSLLLTDNSKAAGISKFPLSKVLTCIRSSSPRGVNTKSSFSTGSMFRTIPTREKRLIITDKTEMDVFPKESQYKESWTAKLL